MNSQSLQSQWLKVHSINCAATTSSIDLCKVNAACEQLLKSKWKDGWQKLQNKLQSCSSALIQATRSFVTVVWPGNHPHIIPCNIPGVHCPRDLSLTCITSSFTVWNSLTMLQHCNNIRWLIFKNSANKLYHSLFIVWLALWKGKMNPIVHCDWLPERVRWRYLSRSGLPAVSRKKIDSVLFPYIINPLFTKLVQSRWHVTALASFIFASSWTRTPFPSKTHKNKTWPLSSHLDWASYNPLSLLAFSLRLDCLSLMIIFFLIT